MKKVLKQISFKQLKKSDSKRSYLYIGIALIAICIIGYYFATRRVFPKYLVLENISSPTAEYTYNKTFASATIPVRKVYSIESEINGSQLNAPTLSTSKYYMINPVTFKLYANSNPNEKVPIASLTKLMSALVLIENYSPSETITFSGNYNNLDWSIGIENGDSMTVENILKAMLISSYNDIAEGVARNYKDGGYDEFISAMNEKASQIGMSNTHFSNASGLYDENNYSTAHDLAKLVAVVQNKKQIMDVVSQKYATGTINNADGSQVSFTSYSTNNLLWQNYNGAIGMKTGTTEGAGQCFVGYFDYGYDDKIVTVVLGSFDRYNDTVNLLESR